MKTIRIVPEVPEDGEIALSMGTKVFMGDTEIKGISKIVTTFDIDEAVRAELSVFVSSDDIHAIPVFKANHPITGEWKQISRIEFEDGTAFDAI